MNKIRALHIKATLSSDGATMVEYGFAKEMNDRVVFDWLISKEPEGNWINRFTELGSCFYRIDYKQTRLRILKIIRKYKAHLSFFKAHQYDIVHFDTDGFHRIVELLAAKRAGVSIRIIHSHNSQAEVSGLFGRNRYLIAIGQTLYRHLATNCIACSDEAAKWLFGDRQALVIKNGIDVEKYKFDQVKRNVIRTQLLYDKQLVFGHVGRFEMQKNHRFLINIFKTIYKVHKEARLLLIGEGSLKKEIERFVDEEGLGEVVTFLGNVDNTYDYYNVMDVFLFPSLFEGLGIVAIEAQCNGLPCIISDTIPRQVQLTTKCHFLSIQNNAEQWAEKAYKLIEPDSEGRKNAYLDIVTAGYDIQTASITLRKLYLRNG